MLSTLTKQGMTLKNLEAQYNACYVTLKGASNGELRWKLAMALADLSEPLMKLTALDGDEENMSGWWKVAENRLNTAKEIERQIKANNLYRVEVLLQHAVKDDAIEAIEGAGIDTIAELIKRLQESPSINGVGQDDIDYLMVELSEVYGAKF